MLNLEKGKCYELSFLRERYDYGTTSKVKIIGDNESDSKTIHCYPSVYPGIKVWDTQEWARFFIYIWDYGFAKGTSIVASGDYSIVGARLLEGAELDEFEAKLKMCK